VHRAIYVQLVLAEEGTSTGARFGSFEARLHFPPLVSTGGSHFGSDQDPSGTIWGSTVIVYQMIDPF